MTKKKPKYAVKIGQGWYRCQSVRVLASGWLHYELKDGTIGLAQPKNWRQVDASPSNR